MFRRGVEIRIECTAQVVVIRIWHRGYSMSMERSSRRSWYDMLPSNRPFVKMHGLRNHFVVVDGRSEPWLPGKDEIIRLCDPQTGIGADQIVAVEAPSAAGEEKGAQALVRFWNVDGREVDTCGNATRCVAWLLLEEQAADEALLETRAGVLRCRRAGLRLVSTEMGRIRTGWRDIPLAEERDTCHLDLRRGPLSDPTALNIGNPHLVFFVDRVDAIDLEALAPPIQNDPLFPEQVNVGVAQMLSESRMLLKVYERGAGVTMACGSGACVAAFAALARGLTESRHMTVDLPGGSLGIEILDDGSAVMTGSVEFCFRGTLPQP
jgi:diaminopimelate epimerase